MSLVLVANSGAGDPASGGSLNYVSHPEGAVYWRGDRQATAHFVEKIACQ